MNLELRAAAARNTPGVPPSGASRVQPFHAQLRAETVERDGQQFVRLDGYASATEQPYEMWDMFGSYSEVISADAFDKTLRADPDVAFLVNHAGVTMARTTNGRLTLEADATGLRAVALVNPKRADVASLVHAIDDGDITEMSFAFVITRGSWSPDWLTYRIEEVDLDRGDVSAVNYGANPFTSIASRGRDLLALIDGLDGPVLRAAHERLAARLDPAGADPEVVPTTGLGVELLRARMALEA